MNENRFNVVHQWMGNETTVKEMSNAHVERFTIKVFGAMHVYYFCYVVKGDCSSRGNDQVRPPWEVIASDESDSETDVDNLEQTDSASCQLVSSVSGSDDTRTSAQAQGGGLTPNTAEIGLVAKDGTKWEYIEFSSGSRDKIQAQNVLTESGENLFFQQPWAEIAFAKS
ncbi:unnamed protein product [Clavelina lepadiformis]|uniref:Uncharacterized protein n=1 Tax=Clavelina lepadiformis TaxID=159417 RepID=A0ABP0FMR3_CLALP